MQKYAKVINEETKECSVGLGTNKTFYKSIGMTYQSVEQAYNGAWYLKGYAPEKPSPTYDEVSELRKQYRRAHIDDKTAERSRKQANGSWTQENEFEYLRLDEEVTEYIEANFPYPEGA